MLSDPWSSPHSSHGDIISLVAVETSLCDPFEMLHGAVQDIRVFVPVMVTFESFIQLLCKDAIEEYAATSAALPGSGFLEFNHWV